MDTRPAIAAIGDNTIDEYTGQLAGSYVGGNALNVAVQCARSGAAAAYFGRGRPGR
jgi:fructoselysine 6-kinase